MQKLGLAQKDFFTIKKAVGWGDEGLLSPFVPKKQIQKALTIYRKHHQKSLLKGSKVFPGVNSLLAYLKNKGYLLAIASNRPTKFTRLLLKVLDLKRFFDYILCADKLRHAKPHPEILKKIIHKFSLKAAQAIYVGDMTIDVRTAKSAGVKPLAVLGGSSSRADLQKSRPFKILASISILKTIL